jgi:hypothetical protein
MHFTREQLIAKGFIKNEQGNWTKIRTGTGNSTQSLPQNTKPERIVRNESMATPSREESDTTRYHISVTGRRKRLLDEDNACVKYFIDALKPAIIPDDAPKKAKITNDQIQVKMDEEEYTIIRIKLENDLEKELIGNDFTWQ